ncbi:MAG: phenylalanine--tRNA ligase subunit alpha, partial [Gammaproteobacteria bacterium]|nr:phenylalanine--tRNA ligase subunit alpha [Gammaproteobacteria bacterium]
MEHLALIIDQAKDDIDRAEDLAALEHLRVKFLGKKGILTAELKKIGGLSKENRKAAGESINQAKETLRQAIAAQQKMLKASALRVRLANEHVDVTLPGRGQSPGGLHPVTQTLQYIESLFAQAGFSVEEGPEIEDDYHNFEALNIPADHPARAMHDTFYFDAHTVLRTHTSPVQIRVMENTAPPLRIIAPG